MRAVCVAVGVLGALGAMVAPSRQKPRLSLVIGGGFDGYLSPCGCTEPMSGGIQRMATIVRQAQRDRSALFLMLGNNVSGVGRQSELKAETVAQVLGGLDGLGQLGVNEARLGKGEMLAMDRLSGHNLLNASLSPSESNPVPPSASRGGFVVGAISHQPALMAASARESAVSVQNSARMLVQQATEAGAPAVVLFDGGHDEAVALAKASPDIALVVYESGSSAPAHGEHVGHTVLVTPGERGKSVLRMTYADGEFRSYEVTPLGPEVSDDARTTRLYREYLSRVDGEMLLDKLPRSPGPDFAGPERCARCHSAAGQVWHASAHSHALATLEAKGHSLDPDCVSCHVTGLGLKTGFFSRSKTPALAAVTCESCHGPGRAHSAEPRAVHMARVGREACISCHNPSNSPNFVFSAYWQRIKH